MEYGRIPVVVAFAAAVIASAPLHSCRKESDRPTWDIDLLAPVLRTSFTLRDLVADSLIRTDADGEVTLVYNGELFDVDLDTVLTAPDTSFFYRYALPLPGPLEFPPGFNFFNQVDVQRFDLDELALRQLTLREGRLELRMTNMVATTVLGSLAIPAAVFPDGSGTLSTSVGPGTPAQPATAVAVRDLAGTRFDLRGPQLNSVNTLQTVLGAQLDPAGNGATVTDQDSLIIQATYAGLLPAYARGYFGQRTVEAGPTTEPFDLFEAFTSGTLDLDEATLKLKVENGFGVDMQVRMRELRATNTRTGASVPLEHAIMSGPMNITRAVDLGTGPAATFYERTLDIANSNLLPFIECLPDQLYYELDIALNPLGDISNGNDFLYDSSLLRASLDLEVPLRLIADELTLQTISAPDLPGSAEGHALRSGTMKLFATNGFPLQARILIDLVDEQGQVLAALPIEGTVAAGLLGPENLVAQPVNSVLTAELDEAAVNLLYDGARLRTRAAFTTADQTMHLRLLDRYRLDLQMTIAANYVVNGDE